jgi:hypothetical protein
MTVLSSGALPTRRAEAAEFDIRGRPIFRDLGRPSVLWHRRTSKIAESGAQRTTLRPIARALRAVGIREWNSQASAWQDRHIRTEAIGNWIPPPRYRMLCRSATSQPHRSQRTGST